MQQQNSVISKIHESVNRENGKKWKEDGKEGHVATKSDSKTSMKNLRLPKTLENFSALN